MRNDFTPQVETREIADGDLDNISGGVLGELVQTAESALPTLSLPGIAGGAGLQISGPVSAQASLSGSTGM